MIRSAVLCRARPRPQARVLRRQSSPMRRRRQSPMSPKLPHKRTSRASTTPQEGERAPGKAPGRRGERLMSRSHGVSSNRLAVQTCCQRVECFPYKSAQHCSGSPAHRCVQTVSPPYTLRLRCETNTSRAPSYFSHFFSEQLHTAAGRATDIRTLYIDRDPDTFRDIALHLQGYHIVPRDGEHFVKLFADAQFYSLPRLTKQLFKSDIFIAIGGVPFRIPRDSFSAPGNSPNYFSLGFAQWFSTPAEVFPGLDRNALLRPPSISPPSVPNKSGEVFAELVRMLMGYEVEIRSPEHRANLIKDARYFHLKGLEQKLINSEMSYNLKRGQNEILIRLEDIRQSGVGFLPDEQGGGEDAKDGTIGGSVTYARPYIDDASLNHHLILETSSSEPATIKLAPSSPQSSSTTAYVSFQGDTLRRITALLNIAATKSGLDPATSSPIPVTLNGDTSLLLNGASVDVLSNTIQKGKDIEWIVRRAHWCIRVERTGEVGTSGETEFQAKLEAVKIEAYTQERGRNAARGFLSA